MSRVYSAVKNQNSLAVLTPYLIPKALHGRKVANIGDGFILRAIERLVGHFSSQQILSPREQPSSEAITLLEAAPIVILAGANQLNDTYSVWPGLTLERILNSSLKFVPFGIGLHGETGFNDGLSAETKAILQTVHERIEYSSWRCPNTVAFLHREIPEIASQILMTGCPVIYDEPLLNGMSFNQKTRRIAVTVTERQDFWARETATIDFVTRTFPHADRYLVLHQNYSPPARLEMVRHRWHLYSSKNLNPYQKLRAYAVQRGFRVVCLPDVDSYIAFYEGMDMHLGSRLHAHLLCLSRAKRSWLVPVDGRASGMADFLGFPLCNPELFEAEMEFDFNIVRERAITGFATMRKFVNSLPT